jgi:hypothetical protein
MAVLDFPASPAIGDKYPVPAVAGQPQYTWDGEKWTTVGAQVTTAAPASALPLMDAATAVVGTATKYAREDHVHPKIPAAPMDAMAFSGMQINGSMDVAQDTINTTVHTKYAIDGWIFFGSAGAMKLNQYGTGALPGFKNYLEYGVTTAVPAPAAGDFFMLTHYVEGWRISRLAWGTANAQPITIGFWSGHHRAGTYTVALRNNPSTQSYCATYTQIAADTWEYKTITIPGCVVGVWKNDNTLGVDIDFIVATGTTLVASVANAWVAGSFIAAPGQVNAVAATTDVFRITGVVVLPGIEAPSAARSPLIMRPYDQELLTCRRYWQKSYAANVSPGTAASYIGCANFYVTGLTNVVNSGGSNVRFGATMRAQPAILGYSPNSGAVNKARDDTFGVDVGPPTIINISDGAFSWYVAQSAAFPNMNITMHWTADARL